MLDILAICNVIIGLVPECGSSTCNPKVTPEVLTFLKYLEPYLATEEFDRLIKMVKEIQPVQFPGEYWLGQNYPNPLNPTTTIQYSVVSEQSLPHVTLKIYNLLGQEIQTLVDEVKEAGYHTVIWDGRDNVGQEVPSGIYFYRLNTGVYMSTKSMLLIQ